jgi:DNA-binding LacI/PurR family transcriptional regulator
VARSLRTSRMYMVMLLLPSIDNPFWPAVAHGLQDTLAATGYAVVLAVSNWELSRERAYLAMARRNRFDAIALNPAQIPPEEVAALGVPAVVLGLRRGYAAFDMVGSDSYQGALEALNYLYGLGHRRIGLIWGSPSGSRSRLRAYADFHARHGLAVDDALIAGTTYTAEGGRSAARALLALGDPPTAIFASNDILALGAIQAASGLGVRVPADLSVVGMDDIETASMSTPPLATVAKDKVAIGKQAARLLLDRLESRAGAAPRAVSVPCRLVARPSAGPPPEAQRAAPQPIHEMRHP